MVGEPDKNDISRDEAALYVKGLSKTFEKNNTVVTAADDISFAVAPGEVIGFLGPNGAGKTTTIKAILGLTLPDKGEVRIQGIDVYDQPRLAYEHVGVMLEGARNDYWRLTVEENLRYFASIRGQNPDTIADRHVELLEHLGIAEKADTAVRELSRGMKQKVSLASVLAGNISVAFLDEPTLGLDITSSLALRRELVRLATERGLTLIISSHDMDVIEDVCDRVIIMNEGRIIVDDIIENLLENFETKEYRITVREADEASLTEFRDQFGVTDVERLNGRTQFEVAANSASFYRLVNSMERHGLVLHDIETIQPNLTEVFVDLTGSEEPAVNPTVDIGDKTHQ